MDNLAHTLVGAALGQAGLQHRTGFGMATLMIAANLPDVDALGLLVGENLAWRRGWTHGPVALLVLPVLLALAMITVDRWQERWGRRSAERPPVRFGWLLALAYIGILSHPMLDYLNTYGIRCLMPFSERWFYGDALFIIDPWMWSLLGIGIWLSRRREKRDRPGFRAPVVAALLLAGGYSAAMGVAGRAAERHAAHDVAALGLGSPRRVLASPVPIDPFRRRILFQVGDAYGFGDFRWFAARRFTIETQFVPTNMDDPAITLARRQERSVRDFLYWSRYPFASIRRTAEGVEVVVADARYGSRPETSRFRAGAFVPAIAAGPVSPRQGEAPVSRRE